MTKEKIKISARCPIRTTLEMLGGKWRLLIINQIGHSCIRFGELKRSLPDISEKMLSHELKTLVANELITRKNYGEVPPRVEYSLTRKGRKALPVIEEMYRFGEKYLQQ